MSKKDANYRLPTSSCSPPRHPIDRPFGIALSSPTFPHLTIRFSRICYSVHIAIFVDRENLPRKIPVDSYLAMYRVLRDLEAINCAASLNCMRSSATAALRLPCYASQGRSFIHPFLYEHGNNSRFYIAVEPDSLIAVLWHLLSFFCHSTACNGRIIFTGPG